MRSTKSRPYRMARRAELVDETRQRITAATARLHTSIGPANTSIAGIAEAAGVTRLTVYRHFPDLEVLFDACRAHWRAQNPPPSIDAWKEIPGLEPRARTALTRLYGWYRDHAEELFPIYRDMTSMPVSSQQTMRAENRRIAELLVGEYAAAGARGRKLLAAARHFLDYRTWRSLAVNQDITDAEAADIGVELLLALVAARSRRGT